MSEYVIPFRPSRHGFRFANRFAAPLLHRVDARAAYGLCGGMAALAHDCFLHEVPVPEAAQPPRAGTPLHRALTRRQLDTLGGAPFFFRIATFAQWTAMSDAEAQRRTLQEAEHVRRLLTQGQLVQLGLLYTDRLTRIWQNHQVLAYGFAEEANALTLRVYDPNYPLRDDVTIRAARSGSGLVCRQYTGGRFVRSVRGFFILPLHPKRPPVL